MNKQRPELLAPAGNLDTFHAAIDAGANAVYLGLADFNARLRAKNFTLQTLAYALPYARRMRVKVYITLNTLIKQNELPALITLLHQLNSMGVDAIIVQDPGIVAIVNKWFPSLALHASTQMVLHNSAGVATAASMGIKRAILARELTFEEIASIRKTAACELEIFIHGALCYSISGLCLASSFLGGSSGNRGRCTQACRRSYTADAASGFFFSPDDFCSLDYIPKFKEIGIHSLKIEGRMKNPQYVHTVTSIYRKAIDDPAAIPELKEAIKQDFGRNKTSFFLSGTQGKAIIHATGAAGIGQVLGPIENTSGNTLFVKTSASLAAHDRIRIQPSNGFEGEAARVLSAAARPDGLCAITIEPGIALHKGDTVYCIGRHTQERNLRHHPKPDERPVAVPLQCPFAEKILSGLRTQTPPKVSQHHETLSILCDSLTWLNLIGPDDCTNAVLVTTPPEFDQLLANAGLLQKWRKKLMCGLPPFIPESDLPLWKSTIAKLLSAGLTRFQISTLGQRSLFTAGVTLSTETGVWCLNRAAQKQLADMGITSFAYSVEDDLMNITAGASERGAVVLFGLMPLFISRIPSALKPGSACTDSHQNVFLQKKQHGLYYLLGKKPLCLFTKKESLKKAGITRFMIDMRFTQPDRYRLKHLLECYRNQERVDNSTMFNFKMGLK